MRLFMVQGPQVTTASASGNETIDTDLSCIYCGYNLRGLAMTGRCPECGHSVDRSVRGDLLRYANRKWLRKMSLGLSLVFFPVMSIIISALAAFFIIPLALADIAPWLLAVWGILVFVVGPITILIGLYLATAREPRAEWHENAQRRRRMVRILVISSVFAILTPFLRIAFPLPVVLSATLNAIIPTVWLVATIFCFLAHLELIAPRIPDSKLAESTRKTKWALTLPLAVIAISCHILMAVAVSQAATGGAQVADTYAGMLGCLNIVAGLFVLIFSLAAVSALACYRKAFKLALLESQSESNHESGQGNDA
jgi:MFS family permease